MEIYLCTATSICTEKCFLISNIFFFFQFLNMLSLSDSFKLMALNQKYRKYSPGVPIKGNASAWWMYAYTSVVEEYVRPKSWERIIEHRYPVVVTRYTLFA